LAAAKATRWSWECTGTAGALAAAIVILCLEIRTSGEASPLTAAAILIVLLALVLVLYTAYERSGSNRISGSATAAGATLTREAALSLLENVAHELRTPIGTVAGFTELLHSPAAEGLTEDETGSYRQFIAEGCKTLTGITHQLLDVVRLERQQLRLLEQDIDAAELVEANLKACAEAAERADVIVKAHLVEGVDLRCDLARTGQALKTMVLLAIAGTPAGGSVEVDFTARRNGELSINVKSRRQLLDKAEIEQLYLPDLRRWGLMGLSLAVARRVLHLHGGDLKVCSSDEDGTAYRLLMPRSRIVWPVEAAKIGTERPKRNSPTLRRKITAWTG
jgi:signal transduction histidine kinase